MAQRTERLTRAVAVVSATAAWVVGTFTGDLDGWPFGLTVGGGAVLTALAVGLPLLAERRARTRAVSAEQIAEDAAARMQLVLDDALEPLVYLVGRITDRQTDLRELRELQGQATAVVLAAAAEVLGGPRLRACYFVLEAGDPARLVNAGFSGRAQAPRTQFVAGTALGDRALALLRDREDLFCRDALVDAPDGWDPAGHDYRTFIVVPVATEAREFGIVTIDGLAAGDLSETDVAAVRVFSRLLAVAFNV